MAAHLAVGLGKGYCNTFALSVLITRTGQGGFVRDRIHLLQAREGWLLLVQALHAGSQIEFIDQGI